MDAINKLAEHPLKPVFRSAYGFALAVQSAIDAFSQEARRILELPDQAQDLRNKARKAVKAADWQVVGAQHYQRVYKPLLKP